MNLIKFNTPFDLLFDEFDVLPTIKSRYLPLSDVSETEDKFELALSVPGYNKSEFKVDVKNDQLLISGEKKSDNNKTIVQKNFLRKFTLPKDIAIEGITASYVDGILTVIIPKNKDAIKTRSIEIN